MKLNYVSTFSGKGQMKTFKREGKDPLDSFSLGALTSTGRALLIVYA